MKLLINENKEYLEGVLATIDSTMNENYKGVTTTYSRVIKHPTEDLFAMIVRSADVDLMIGSYPDELSQIGVDLISQLQDYSDEWKIQEEE